MSPLRCRRRRPQRRPRCRLLVERLADRILPAGDLLAATSLLQPTDRLDATIGAPGEVDRFQFTLAETGRLTVRTGGLDLDTRTSLLDADGQLLIQSDGASATAHCPAAWSPSRRATRRKRGVTQKRRMSCSPIRP